MKNDTLELLQACRVARRMGATVTKRTICPGCGKVQAIEGDEFALRVDAEQIIPAKGCEKADGVKWCNICR